MDNLLKIYNEKLTNLHILIKAAFLHHAFVQIHPFQDGNGRIARLLASFILIKEGLFPLSIDRKKRTDYINALEIADSGKYQKLIDVFSQNQISSIQQSLNWKTVEDNSGYDNVLDQLNKKLTDYRAATAKEQKQRIYRNMQAVFEVVKDQTEYFRNDLTEKLDATISIKADEPKGSKMYYFTKQIIEYASKFDYYANMSLDKCWTSLFIDIDDTNKYRLLLTVHHYGYDNSTFALGAVISKVIPESSEEGHREYIDIPLGVPPLTLSSERSVEEVTLSIKQQIKIFVMAALALIANEL
jgi:fido (protein-threonine AMPylation protein)